MDQQPQLGEALQPAHMQGEPWLASVWFIARELSGAGNTVMCCSSPLRVWLLSNKLIVDSTSKRRQATEPDSHYQA